MAYIHGGHGATCADVLLRVVDPPRGAVHHVRLEGQHTHAQRSESALALVYPVLGLGYVGGAGVGVPGVIP